MNCCFEQGWPPKGGAVSRKLYIVGEPGHGLGLPTARRRDELELRRRLGGMVGEGMIYDILARLIG